MALGVGITALAWVLLRDLLSTLPLIRVCLFLLFVSVYYLLEAFCNSDADQADALSGERGTEDAPLNLVADSVSARSAAAPKKTSSKKSTARKTTEKSPKAPAKTTRSAAAKTKSTSGAPARSKSASASKGPQLFTKRPAQVDDLKMIAGVGPKLETVLNDLGVYQWKQVAGWKKADVVHVNERLKFKGRIEREEWVKQAKALAKGGEAEYIKVFGKKPR